MEIKVPKTCEVACLVKMKKSDKDAFVRAIDDEYRIHWTVDNLPVGKYIRSCVFIKHYIYIICMNLMFICFVHMHFTKTYGIILLCTHLFVMKYACVRFNTRMVGNVS